MKKNQQKNSIYRVRHFLFNTALLLSIFSFSGYAIQIHSFQNKVKTEFVDTNYSVSFYQINSIEFFYGDKETRKSISNSFNFNKFDCFKKKTFLDDTFLSIKNRALPYSAKSIQLPLKLPTPNSEEEPFLHILS